MSIYTDDTTKNLFFYDGSTEITEDVIFGSFKLEDTLCTDDLNFGECNSARVEFETSSNLNLTGKTITIYYGTEATNSLIGTFKVYQTSTAINTDVCKIIAYDCVKAFDVDVVSWHEGIQYPISLKDLRDSLCSYIGVTQATVTLDLDDILIDETMSAYELNGRDILCWIGQICACFPHATTDGKLNWITLGTVPSRVPTEAMIGANALRSKGYQTADIDGVAILVEEGDVGGYSGSFDNRIEIIGNPLTFGRSDLNTICASILNKIQNIKYTPCEIDLKYLPDFPIGSCMNVGSTIFYNFGIKISGAMECTIACSGEEYRDTAGSITSDIVMLKGKSNVLKRDVDTLSNTISDVDSSWRSALTQTAESFSLEISNIYDELDGATSIYYTTYTPVVPDNAEEGGTYPAYDWTKSIPCDGSKQLGTGLKFEYTDEWFREHKRAMAFDEDNAISYRFKTSSGVWVWMPVEDEDFSILFARIVTLEATTESITAEVETVKETHYTKTETDSKIQVASESITASVSQNYYDKTSGNALSSKVSSIEIDLSGITSTVSDISTTVDSHSTRITTVEQTADGLTTSVSNLSDTVDGNTSRIATVEQTADRLTTSVSSIEDMQVYQNRRIATVEQTADGLTTSVSNISDTVNGQNAKISTVEQTATSLSATVSEKADKSAGDTSFKYELKSTGFKLYSNNSEVFKCDSTGISVNGSGTFTGTITANEGKIGNLTIYNGSIYDGKTTLTDANDGIRINKSGIALGKSKAFYVNSAGELTCKSGKIGGCSIVDNVLQIKDVNISGRISASHLDSSLVTTTYLTTNYLTATDISASYATIKSLNTLNATVKGKLTTTELDSKISALAYLHVGSVLYFNNTTANATIIQVPKGDGSGTMINITAKELLRAVGKG